MTIAKKPQQRTRTPRHLLCLGLIATLCLPLAPINASAGINPGKALGSASKKAGAKKAGAQRSGSSSAHRAGRSARSPSTSGRRGASPGPQQRARSAVAAGTRGGTSKPQRPGIKIREGNNTYSSAGPLGKRPAPNTRTAQPGKSILKKPPQRGRLGPNGVTHGPARTAAKGKQAVRQVIRPASPARNGSPARNASPTQNAKGGGRSARMATAPSDLKRYQSRKDRGEARKLKSLKKLKGGPSLSGNGQRVATRGTGRAYAPDNTKKLKRVAKDLEAGQAGTSGSRLKKAKRPQR